MKNTISHLISMFILLVLSTSGLNAQPGDSIKYQVFKEKSFVTFNLLSPVDQLVPRWRIGYIRSINPNWKAGIEFGYGNKKLAFADVDADNEADYQLWEIRPELYYILDPLKKTQKYVSAELFYINHTDVFYNKIEYDRADYSRQKYGFHLKYGLIIQIAKHFGLNIYTGFGLRIRSNSYTKIVNPTLEIDHRDFYIGNYKDFGGVTTGVDFSLGVKLVVH